ncbi:MAG: hypothetical protein GX826_07850 [Gammaproteobacteria bacterium]|nr:hypothetical protein [Gammaproteobacteria bacterium]
MNFIDSLMDDWQLRPREDSAGNRFLMRKRLAHDPAGDDAQTHGDS